jgi:flavin-dependent dehydrogenase
LFAFKAAFTQSSAEEGVLPVLSFRGGYGGMVLGEQGMLTLACCIRRDCLAALRRQAKGSNAGAAVQAYLMNECSGVRTALQGATRHGRWLSVGPLYPGMRMPRDGGRFFLVGNAAGEAHPIIGEGMSMAMQAAWLLSDCLLRQPQVLRDADLQRMLLRDYAKTWRAHFAPRMRLAAAFAHAAMRPAVARAMLPVLRTWPGILTRAAHRSGKVSPARGLPGYSPDSASYRPHGESRLHEVGNGENA